MSLFAYLLTLEVNRFIKVVKREKQEINTEGFDTQKKCKQGNQYIIFTKQKYVAYFRNQEEVMVYLI